MKKWAQPLAIGYLLGAFIHLLLFLPTKGPTPFWFGDLYWAGTGFSLFGLAQTLEDQKKGRFIPVYFVGGILRLLLGVGVVLLPLVFGDKGNYQSEAIQFVSGYGYVLILESAVAINWIKNK